MDQGLGVGLGALQAKPLPGRRVRLTPKQQQQVFRRINARRILMSIRLGFRSMDTSAGSEFDRAEVRRRADAVGELLAKLGLMLTKATATRLPARPGSNIRKCLTTPFLDRFRVALVSALQWLLWRQSELGEQLPDRRQPKPHVELLLDQIRYH